MKEAPKLNVDTAPREKEEFAATEEAVQDRSDLGGESLNKAIKDERISQDTAKIIDTKGKLEKVMSEAKLEATKETLPTMDISVVKAKIKEIEESAAKQNWFKRQFSDTGETIKRLKLGLYKIEDPKFKGKFEQDFQAAYAQGGEELAMEYLEDIGAGKLVRPENGVLMVSDLRNQDKFFNQ